MPQMIHKPVFDSGRIAIFFPTRGRPDAVGRLLDSIHRTVSDPTRVEVWAWVDEDDQPTRECFRSVPFPARTVTGPTTVTQGEMYNLLRAECDTGPGVYMVGSDKMVFETKGWDDKVRDAFGRYPDGIHYAYPRDSVNQGRFGAFFFLGAGWANTIGHLTTEHFPFWYVDTWAFMVGNLIGRAEALDMDVQLVPGPTIRMHNLYFWDRFYHAMGHERIREASQLIFGSAEPSAERLLRAERLAARFDERRGREAQRDADLKQWERALSIRMRSNEPVPALGSPYRVAEDRAVARLLGLRRAMLEQGRQEAVGPIEDAVAHSSLAAEDHALEMDAALRRGAAHELEELVSAYVSRFPNLPGGYLARCDLLELQGDLRSALEEVEAAMALFSGLETLAVRRTRLRHRLSAQATGG